MVSLRNPASLLQSQTALGSANLVQIVFKPSHHPGLLHGEEPVCFLGGLTGTKENGALIALGVHPSINAIPGHV